MIFFEKNQSILTTHGCCSTEDFITRNQDYETKKNNPMFNMIQFFQLKWLKNEMNLFWASIDFPWKEVESEAFRIQCAKLKKCHICLIFRT